jgi:hypothetical protein
MRETFNIIKESINETIRKLLPFKEILKKYLGNPEDSFDDSASIISEPLVLKPSNKMMRKLLGDEIDEESVYSFTANEKNIEEDFAEENISVQSSTDTIEEKEEDKTNDIMEDSYETETLNDFQFRDENIKEEIFKVDEKEISLNSDKKFDEIITNENIEEEQLKNKNTEEELVSEEKTIVLNNENKVELTQENIKNLGLNIEENKQEKIIENLNLESKELESKEFESKELESNVVESNVVESNMVESNELESIEKESNVVESDELESIEKESNVVKSNELKVKNEDLFEIDTFINKSKNKNSKDSIIIPVKRKVVKRKKLNYKNKFLTPDRLTVSNENIKRESSFEDELKNNILFSDLQDERENEL